MKIIYTVHALERIRQRNINRNLIERCLNNPDRSEELDEIHKCIKKIDDRVLIVIYKRVNDTIIVITAYTSSKLYKYLP